MSSYAQCLFGLDGEGGRSRYRLLPVRGWQLLLAKDAAFLIVLLPLTLTVAILPGNRRCAGGARGRTCTRGGKSTPANEMALLHGRRAGEWGGPADCASHDRVRHRPD